MRQNQSGWSRRTFLRFSGGVASVALLAACHPIVAPAATEPISSAGISAGKEPARFAYVGAYTRSAPSSGTANAQQSQPDGIAVFAVTPSTGALTHVETVPSDNPSFLAIHPTQRYLYASNEIADYAGKEAGSLEAYAIDERTGKLTLLNRQAVGSMPSYLAIDPSGSALVVATARGASYQVLPIKAYGILEPVSDEVKQRGSGPHERQAAPHPSCVIFDPGGRYIATADLGIDKVEIFKLVNGKLVKVSEATLAPGSGPRQIAFHPTAKALYVMNELTATITAFAYDAESGAVGNNFQTLVALPADLASRQNRAEIRVHPSGKFLYASNLQFKDYPLVNDMTVFPIDEATGKLGAVMDKQRPTVQWPTKENKA